MQSIPKNILMLLLVCLITTNSYAGWSGPSEIISANWGTADNQVGLISEDTSDSFPEGFWILGDMIVIRDQVNRRMKIYGMSGVQEKIVNWVVQANGSFKIPEYPLAGDLAGYISDNLVTYYAPQRYYVQYSPTGQIIQTFTTRPVELGKVTEKRVDSTHVKIVVAYPDRTYSCLLGGPYEKYQRGADGKLYALTGKLVKKIGECGRELGSLALPRNKSRVISPGGGGSDRVTELIEEYGQPIIARSGDVYAWKRTPDKYSIIKWTWVDDSNTSSNAPDAPSNLSVRVSPTGLDLTWKPPYQDPGCVTGYEVSRTTISGSGYSLVGTVSKSIYKFTDTTALAGTLYYYTVRAMDGTEYSAYSNEVSGSK